MTDGFNWTIVAVLTLILLLFIFFIKKEKNKKVDYKAIANLGIVFTFLGVFSLIRYGESLFFILGLVFLGVGYSKKSKWKKNS